MAEIRTDWLTGRTVILAEDRALRPNEFDAETAAPPLLPSACPFCPGQESLTPPAVYVHGDADGEWQIRVVPNKFPALTVDALANGEGIPAIGAHEVIVESRRHAVRMAELSSSELADVLTAYRERLGYWRSHGKLDYGLVFKNLGAKAGASLAHVHSQLIALPELPPAAAAEYARAERHYVEHADCAYCRLIAGERAASERIVYDDQGLVAFCPFASLQPAEVWLMPSDHRPWFEQSNSTGAVDPLPTILHTLLAKIEHILPWPSYNVLVKTAPWRESAARCGHWRIEILPRVNSLAGLELATGIHINPISPTKAARELRIS